MLSEDHSLFRRRANTWTKTNVATHIAYVMYGGCIPEIRVLKLWRNQKGLDFPSFYLELAVIAALRGSGGTLSQRVSQALTYIRDNLSPSLKVYIELSNEVWNRGFFPHGHWVLGMLRRGGQRERQAEQPQRQSTRGRDSLAHGHPQ